MLQPTSALGVSHPLDGLGPEPLGKYCIPSRTGFASFLVRALTLARPSTPTPEAHIAVNPLRSTLLADPLGSPTSRWASLPEHPAYQRPEDPRQYGTDGRCTPRDPPKRTYRRERSCHVAFPDAHAPYEERHSPPAALCHHSAWPSCRFETSDVSLPTARDARATSRLCSERETGPRTHVAVSTPGPFLPWASVSPSRFRSTADRSLLRGIAPARRDAPAAFDAGTNAPNGPLESEPPCALRWIPDLVDRSHGVLRRLRGARGPSVRRIP